MPEELNYKKDVSIDKYQLDEELAKQGKLFMAYSEAWASLVTERDKKKEALTILKAELDADVRRNPQKYGMDKVTETAISSIISMEKSVQQYTSEIIDLNEDINIHASARMALEQKKSMLESLVRLFLANYYSDEPIERRSAHEQALQESGASERIRRAKEKHGSGN